MPRATACTAAREESDTCLPNNAAVVTRHLNIAQEDTIGTHLALLVESRVEHSGQSLALAILRRRLIRHLEARGRRIYPDNHDGCVTRLGPHTVLKTGPRVRLTEARTMAYVRAHTSIPMPAVLDAWTHDRGGAIVMTFCDGTPLDRAWAALGPNGRARTAAQLRSFVRELRALRQPSGLRGRIGPLDGAPLEDARLWSKTCGPFASESDLNSWRLSMLDRFTWEPKTRRRVDALRAQLRSDHRIVLTHGDLDRRNILVDQAGNVTAILDWEMSGWMPEHWEYLKSRYCDGDAAWVAFVRTTIPTFDDELKLDDEIMGIHGSPF